MAEKRKTYTSPAVKARYNKKVYEVIAVRLKKEKVIKFKEKCVKEGVSQASVVDKAIDAFLEQ